MILDLSCSWPGHSRWPEVLIVTSTEFDKLQGKLAELFMGFHVNQGLLMEVEIVLARVGWWRSC